MLEGMIVHKYLHRGTTAGGARPACTAVHHGLERAASARFRRYKLLPALGKEHRPARFVGQLQGKKRRGRKAPAQLGLRSCRRHR